MKQDALEVGFRAFDARWKVKNRSKPRLLVYTDSRGMNVSTANAARVKHHYGSHVDALQRGFHVDHVVCPYSHTTMLDFLEYLDGRGKRYDAVVLHCGIVEFSPRPPSNIERIREAKRGRRRFEELFAQTAEYHANPQGAPYKGDATTTLYSPAFLDGVLDELAAIDGLIWITSNRFVPGWDGNWKARPSDIDATVERFDRQVQSRLENVVDLRDWSYDEVQRFTVDNVHFTKAGFADVADRTRQIVDRVLSARA